MDTGPEESPPHSNHAASNRTAAYVILSVFWFLSRRGIRLPDRQALQVPAQGRWSPYGPTTASSAGHSTAQPIPGDCSGLVLSLHAFSPSTRERAERVAGGSGVCPTSWASFPTGPVGNLAGRPQEYTLPGARRLGARTIVERMSRCGEKKLNLDLTTTAS